MVIGLSASYVKDSTGDAKKSSSLWTPYRASRIRFGDALASAQQAQHKSTKPLKLVEGAIRKKETLQE
jgi:hypothetical protein